MTSVEVGDRLRSVEVVPRDPLVMFGAITSPFDEVLGATIADARVQELLNVVLQFSGNDDWFGRRRLFATREGLRWHREELDDWEDRVKSAH